MQRGGAARDHEGDKLYFPKSSDAPATVAYLGRANDRDNARLVETNEG
jgi:hypothetical protein